MSVEPAEFVRDPLRDAKASIRGYVYQVDISILRWLTLGEGDILELECGEDIDVIQRAIAQAPTRILEQVKISSSAITLNSAGPKAALSNFRRHLLSNPSHNLRFRYVTTSEIAVERPARFPDGSAGIVVWQELRIKAPHGDVLGSRLSGIREILKTGTKPANVQEDDWNEFVTFIRISANDDLLRFIRAFEWNTDHLSPDDVEQQIRMLLRSRTGRTSSQEVEEIYQRLFLFVFKTLSRVTPNRLTIETLDAELSGTPIRSEDRVLLAAIQVAVGSLEERVAKLEAQQSRFADLLGKQIGIAQIQYSGPDVIVDLPPLVTKAVPRKQVVAKVRSALDQATWCYLTGASSSGKTQLAILVTHSLSPTPSIWIRLRDRSAAQCCDVVDRALEMATGIPRMFLHEKWYEEVCAKLGKGSLIILDDLPRRGPGHEDLEARLFVLGQACSRHNVKILSTCSEPPSLSLKDVLGDSLEEFAIPTFSDDEIALLLGLYGAPARDISSLTRIVGTITRRQTLLVRAAAQYLSDQEWSVDERTLENLFSGDYAKSLEDPIRKSLAATTASDTRELLYRLTLVGGSFSISDVKLIARVAPEIKLPIEKVTAAVGLWIHEEGESKYSTSPLLDSVHTDLNQRVERNVHFALGAAILKTKRLTLPDGMNAFRHFTAGGDKNRAAFILLKALMALNEREGQIAEDWGFSLVWKDMSLPEEIPLSIRMCIRALQAVVGHRRGFDIQALLNDLDALALKAKPGIDDLGVVFSSGWVVLRLGKQYPSRANAYALKMLTLAPKINLPKPLAVPEPLEGMLWVTARGIQTQSELADWLRTVAAISPEQRKRLFDSPPSDVQCLLLCDGIWDRERRKPREQQNWKSVLNQILRVQEFAIQTNNILLQGCAVRAQIIVFAELMGDLQGAIAIAAESYPKVSLDSKAAFLVAHTIAIQFDTADRYQEAREWAERAIESDATPFPVLHRDALLLMSRATIPSDAEKSIRYAAEAIALARSSRLGGNTEIETLGEMAIACWRLGRRQRCFQAFKDTVSTLLASRSGKSRWKRLFVLCGHTAGYFASVAQTGKAPRADYFEPYPGLFLVDHPVDDLYDAGREWNLPLQVALFADALNLPVEADQWFRTADEMAQPGPAKGIVRDFAWLGIAQAILSNDFREALQLAQENTKFDSATTVEELHKLGIQDAQTWQSKRRDLAQSGYRHGQIMLMALVPFAFRIAVVFLENPGKARQLAAVAAELMQEVSRSEQNSAQWYTASVLIQDILNSEPDWKSLFRQGQEFGGQGETGLSILCFLGVVVRADLRQSLASQCYVFEFADRFYPKVFQGLYGSVVAPFAEAYWRHAMDVRGFELGSPLYLRKQVDDSLEMEPRARVKRILSAAVADLRIKLPADLSEWLRGTT